MQELQANLKGHKNISFKIPEEESINQEEEILEEIKDESVLK